MQAAKAEKKSIQQVIRSEAVLYPKNQAAITPKIVAPVKQFYVNRGSRVHAGQLLAVIENRDLAAAETETKGSLPPGRGRLSNRNHVRRCPKNGRRPNTT